MPSRASSAPVRQDVRSKICPLPCRGISRAAHAPSGYEVRPTLHSFGPRKFNDQCARDCLVSKEGQQNLDLLPVNAEIDGDSNVTSRKRCIHRPASPLQWQAHVLHLHGLHDRVRDRPLTAPAVRHVCSSPTTAASSARMRWQSYARQSEAVCCHLTLDRGARWFLIGKAGTSPTRVACMRRGHKLRPEVPGGSA